MCNYVAYETTNHRTIKLAPGPLAVEGLKEKSTTDYENHCLCYHDNYKTDYQSADGGTHGPTIVNETQCHDRTKNPSGCQGGKQATPEARSK